MTIFVLLLSLVLLSFVVLATLVWRCRRPREWRETPPVLQSTSEGPESPPTPPGSSLATPPDDPGRRILISIEVLDRIHKFLTDISLDKSHPDAETASKLAVLVSPRCPYREAYTHARPAKYMASPGKGIQERTP